MLQLQKIMKVIKIIGQYGLWAACAGVFAVRVSYSGGKNLASKTFRDLKEQLAGIERQICVWGFGGIDL